MISTKEGRTKEEEDIIVMSGIASNPNSAPVSFQNGNGNSASTLSKNHQLFNIIRDGMPQDRPVTRDSVDSLEHDALSTSKTPPALLLPSGNSQQALQKCHSHEDTISISETLVEPLPQDIIMSNRNLYGSPNRSVNERLGNLMSNKDNNNNNGKGSSNNNNNFRVRFAKMRVTRPVINGTTSNNSASISGTSLGLNHNHHHHKCSKKSMRKFGNRAIYGIMILVLILCVIGTSSMFKRPTEEDQFTLKLRRFSGLIICLFNSVIVSDVFISYLSLLSNGGAN